MGTYKTLDDIIKEKHAQLESYEGMIDAWEHVTIEKKQDGTEYSALTNRCIDGAKLVNKEYTSGKEISVHYSTTRGWYNCDTIDAFRRIEVNGYYVKELLSPAELREAIEERIERYKGYKANTENALTWLEDNADIIKQKMESFREDLFKGAPDDIGIRHAFGDIVGDGIKFGFR